MQTPAQEAKGGPAAPCAAASVAEHASLMQFLHSGPMLRGACAAIYAALVMGAGRLGRR